MHPARLLGSWCTLVVLAARGCASLGSTAVSLLQEFANFSQGLNAAEGVEELAEAEELEFEDYFVDNSKLRHPGPGVLWRLSKKLNDTAGKDEFAAWGSLVRGFNTGDGWLKVGRRYLPVQVRGQTVLLEKKQPEYTTVEEKKSPEKPATRLRVFYKPTAIQAKDGSWIPCNITGFGKVEGTYNVIVQPRTLGDYPLNNVPLSMLQKVVRVRQFVPMSAERSRSSSHWKRTLAQSGNQVMTATVKEQSNGREHHLKFLRKSPMRVLMKMTCDRMNIGWGSCQHRARFQLLGRQVFPGETAADLNLTDGSEFEVLFRRRVEEE